MLETFINVIKYTLLKQIVKVSRRGRILDHKKILIILIAILSYLPLPLIVYIKSN